MCEEVSNELVTVEEITPEVIDCDYEIMSLDEAYDIISAMLQNSEN